jgi:hypothetical protein
VNKLYDFDYVAWTRDQADALRRRSTNELDWDNLVEEVGSLGRQQQSELRSHLIVLLTHLLKWRHQPERRSRSWTLTILEQRREAERVVRQNPSLKPEVDEILADAYRISRLRAARQTRLSTRHFPKDNPFTWSQAMSEPVGEED